MAVSFLSFLVGDDTCSEASPTKCFAFVIFSLSAFSFACLPIIFIAEAAWSAFKKRRHWIPAGSLVVGALVLQFLPLLNKSFNFPGDIFSRNQQSQVKDKLKGGLLDDYYMLSAKNYDGDTYYTVLIFYSNWVSVVSGRVSVFVLMGCLLPGVARPLSSNLWRDMSALLISSSLFLFHISYETFKTSKLLFIEDTMSSFVLVLVWNLTMLIALAILVLILFSAALASVSISKTWLHKIPTLICAQNFSTLVVWEEVEERASRSLIVARTADPQYILARSILTSTIAFVITISNGILIFEICRFVVEGLAGTFVDIWFVLRCTVIIIGSILIYWRCITAVVFYPKRHGWKLSGLAQFFQIENFWKSHLLDFIDSFNTLGESGDKSLGGLTVRMCSKMRFHKLLYVLYYLQMLSIFLSKICWLSTELLFSNKYLAKLLLGSTYSEFCNLSRSKSHRVIVLGQSSFDFDKYLKSLVVIQGENPAGIWMANKKSIQEIKEQMKKGEEKGRKECNDLTSLLNYSCIPNFPGERCVRLQIGPQIRLEIERELDVEWKLNVHKCSWKMAAVSIIVVIIELSSFTSNRADADDRVDSAMKACSQAWNIMDVIEYSDGEAFELSETANNIFQNLQKKKKWLDYPLPVSKPVERTPTAAKEAMNSLSEKGKQIAGQHQSRKWSETVAGYNLYKLGVQINDQFTNAEAVLDILREMLADLIGSCTVKAVGVIMEDCKKRASLYDEESILRIAGIAGKVKGVTEILGWKLKLNADEETQSIKTSLAGDQVHNELNVSEPLVNG